MNAGRSDSRVSILPRARSLHSNFIGLPLFTTYVIKTLVGLKIDVFILISILKVLAVSITL